MVRRPSPARTRLAALGCTTVEGDLKDTGSLAAACRGADALIATANGMMSRSAGDSLKAVDRDGMLALVATARQARIRHFVYTSVSPVLPADSPFVRYKRQVEDAVRASGLTWTILQPSAFMEIHAGAAAGWDFQKGRARILGSGRAPVSYVSASDVAAFAVASVLGSAAVNRDLRIAGPEPLSALDAVRVAEQVTGRRFRVQRLPAAALPVLSLLVRPFNESLGSLFRMAVALDRGEVHDMRPLLREIPIELTTFEQYVREATARP
jgi:uncharacterized protein YbjT (DUF2867 family)